jgi:hypothetical protein
MIGIAAAPSAAASDAQVAASVESAPAPEWAPEACARVVRTRGHRYSLSEPRQCREPAVVARGCERQIDIRAASLRYATGRRRHDHVSVCR